ncbi:MAG: hypothetical protein HON90_03260 [Halobacteriovoraceae bacterium]|jgi:hypothetical protein|nr:hypothetical protein [Halobacteriovoraceae bacterium]
MKTLLLIILTTFTFTASAWQEVISCNEHDLVLDKKNTHNYPEYQIVINNTEVAKYFITKGGVAGKQLPDGRLVLSNIYKNHRDEYSNHAYVEQYSFKLEGNVGLLQTYTRSGYARWYFESCK